MDSPSSNTSNADSPGPLKRRGFLAGTIAIVAGGFALLVPAVVSLVSWLNPLRQKSPAGEFKLALLDELPENGTPKRIPVITDRIDAWNRFLAEPVGAVFLRRAAENEVEAFQATCPHAGCTIQFQNASEDGKFFCPCHAASFGLGGERLDKPSPSPRDMDSLDVEIRNENEVWVKFRNFQTGTAKKIAKA